MARRPPMPPEPTKQDTSAGLLRTVAATTAGVTGEAYFRTLVARLAEAFGAEIAYVAEAPEDSDPAHPSARVLASGGRRDLLPEGTVFAAGAPPCAGFDAQLTVDLPGGAVSDTGHIGVLSTRPIATG